MIFVAQGIARRNILNSDDGRDISRVTGIDILALIRLNLDKSRDTFALVRPGVINIVAFT